MTVNHAGPKRETATTDFHHMLWLVHRPYHEPFAGGSALLAEAGEEAMNTNRVE